MPRFAANLTMLWPDLDVYDRFRTAAEAGFRRVEILFVHALDAGRVERALRENGLELVLFDPAPGDWNKGERGLLSVPGREQEFLATVRDAVSSAQRFGTKLLNALAGIPPAGVPRATAERTALANLRAAAPLVEKIGASLLVEAINPVDMPGYFADTVERAAALVEGAGSPSVRLQLDQYHVGMAGAGARAAIRRGASPGAHLPNPDGPGPDPPRGGAQPTPELPRRPGLSRREAFLQHDTCLPHFGADRVGLAHARGQCDGWMAREAGLDLAGADAIATAGDQIVVAADESEVARLIAHAQVAADQPVSAELRLRRCVVAPVFEEHHRIGAVVGDAPHFSCWQLAAVFVDDRNSVSGDRRSRPSRTHRRQCAAVSHHQVAFRLAVELIDGQAERAAAPIDQVFAEALSARCEAAQTHARILGAGGAQQLQRRRRHEHVADVIPSHQPHRLGRIELPRPVRDHGDAVVPGGHHDVEQPADPGPVRGRPEAVAGLREAVVRVLHSREVAEERAMRMQRALRLTGGAARVDDERRILGERVGDLETVRRLRGQR